MRNEIILRGEPQRAHVIEFLRNLRINPDKPFVVTVEPLKKKRSLPQLALYWKWVHEVCEIVARDTGNDPEDIHEFLKRRFLSPKIVDVNGHTMERWTTTKLTVPEMSDYMTRIHAFVTGELGILLTLPEERFAS